MADDKLTERLAGKIVCYHGTSKENVDSILKEGFRKGSYFAYRVEDSLRFGGLYLFAVGFSTDASMWHGEEDGFQFHLRESLGPGGILWHTEIVQRLITEQQALQREADAKVCEKYSESAQGLLDSVREGDKIRGDLPDSETELSRLHVDNLRDQFVEAAKIIRKSSPDLGAARQGIVKEERERWIAGCKSNGFISFEDESQTGIPIIEHDCEKSREEWESEFLRLGWKFPTSE